MNILTDSKLDFKIIDRDDNDQIHEFTAPRNAKNHDEIFNYFKSNLLPWIEAKIYPSQHIMLHFKKRLVLKIGLHLATILGYEKWNENFELYKDSGVIYMFRNQFKNISLKPNHIFLYSIRK